MIYRFICFLILVSISVFADESPSTPETTPIITTLPSPVIDNQSEATPAIHTSPDYEQAFVKMMVTLAVLLILIVATVWLLRRYSSGRIRGMNRNLSIKVLERRPLSQKTSLYIIEAGGKKLLISESQLEVRTLSPMEEETTPLNTET